MTVEHMNFEKMISVLETNKELHARFVNTISYLEYMGARKLLKSQREEKINFQILAHAGEEIRHAQSFKKIALKMSDGKLSTYSEPHLLCGKEARQYFQSLDESVHSEIGADPYRNYLYTTLLIEERASQVYPVYEPVLARAGYPGILKSIVREEGAHLKEILESLKEEEALQTPAAPNLISVDKMIELRMLEAAAFEHFVSSITKILAQPLVQPEGGDQTPSQPGLTRVAQDHSEIYSSES